MFLPDISIKNPLLSTFVMANNAYARLSDIFSIPQLPAQLAVVQQSTSAALDNIYYRNLDVTPRSDAYSLAGYIELVSYKELKLEVLGTGFYFVLNPGQVINTGRTIIPLAFSYSIGIGRYIPDFRQLQVPTDAQGLFELLLRITGVTDAQLLNRVLHLFESGTNAQSVLDNFRAKAIAEFGASNGLTLTAPLPNDTVQAVEQIRQAFAATAATTTPLTLSEALLQLYILTGTPVQALDNVQQLLASVVGPNWQGLLRDLFVPQIRAQLQVSAGVQIPRNILLPMIRKGNGTYAVDTDPDHYATLVFAQGTLQFNTQGGFGYNIEVAASLERAQLGTTGLQVAFTKAKLDLSDVTNIAEADADGRPNTFKGIYAREVDIFLPDGWTYQPGSVQLAATDLLIGTGGVSGKFGVKSGVTSTLPSGTLIQARLFQDVLVNFRSFDISFRRNEVIASTVTGSFSLENFKRTDGSAAEFNFTLLFSANGYQLIFDSTVNPVIVQLGSVGTVNFTRLAIGYELGDWYIEISAQIELNKSLPIVGKVLPRKINVRRLLLSTDPAQTALEIQPIWADGTSVRGDLTTGLSITQVINLSILDVIRVDLFRLSVARAQNGDITALATINSQLRLTPESSPGSQNSKEPPRGFVAKVNNVGFYARFSFRQGAEGGNLGPAEVTLDFKLPDTVAVSINAEGVSGSGYLAILNNGERYEGTIALTFRNGIKVSAYAILLDRLPSGEPGPSLLVVVMAQFTPVQLGLGFTLNGVGGLIGLHRTVSIPVLRSAVSSGSLEQILFPPNPSANTAQILSSLDSAFPPDFGRHTFGLLARIGWGAPKTLLTLDVGLIIELPAPVRLVLLGVLRAVLPSLDKPILRLRADFLGSVDFGAGSVEFDATLRDSSILDRFTLSGDGAFRLYQGQNPVFLLTTGGFHPAFQPPANANLRPLQRLRLALADSRDFRLVLQTYLAITANTVQVGARLDLFVDLPLGFYLEGYLYFDTLFQFNPFRLDVQIGAGVAIKRNGKNKLSLQLYLHVTGPAPWHVTGEVSFKIIIRVRFSINRTIGGGAPAQPLPNVDVRQLLRQALAAPSSWEVQAPASSTASTVVLRAEPDATRLLVDPGGALVVRQKVAPLAYALERYGNARPQNGNRFDITQARFGQEGNGLLLTGPDLQEVTDFFAPGEFRRMSEAQRLSAPSFQLMRSGVRLPALEGFVGGPATVQKVGYELIVLGSPTPAGTPIIPPPATEAARSAALAAMPAPVAERRMVVAMPAQQFQQLSQNSAIGQAYTQAQPSYLAPEEVYWQEDQYVLARTDTLARYAPTTFANEAQATAALQAAVAADSRLRGELLVVPVYQLELQSV